MKHRTEFTATARQELRRIDRVNALRILRKLAELEDNPYGLGTTELVTRPGVRRLRVGDFRALYTVDGGQLVVLVVGVAHRSVAYEG